MTEMANSGLKAEKFRDVNDAIQPDGFPVSAIN